MQTPLRLLIIGLAAYLLFLPAVLPAAFVISWLGMPAAGFSFGDVGGTAWAGHVETLRYDKVNLDKVRWNFRPLGLLLGRLEYQIRILTPDSRGTGRAGRGIFGDYYLRDTHADLSTIDLNPLLPPNSVRLGGTFHLDLKKAAYRNGPIKASGNLTWKDATIVDPLPVSLGSLQMLLDSVDDGAKGTLTDLDEAGPLAVQAELSLGADRNYRVTGTLKPRASLPVEVRRALPFLGVPDAEGRYRVEFAGTL